MNENDEKTRIIGHRVSPVPAAGTDNEDEKTRIIRQPAPVEQDFATGAPTRVHGAGEARSVVPPPLPQKHLETDEKTVLFNPRKTVSTVSSGNSSSEESISPVVGWLVIVDGPGKGSSHTLNYGVNRIGRDAGQPVSLAYGDNGISRENHSSLIYDHKNRNFFLQQGQGSGLTYLQGAPVLQPIKLEGHERISMGATTLVFIPFCNHDFDWEDA